MTKENDLKSLESKLRYKIYTSYHADGLIDILMGWNLIWIGIFLYTHTAWLAYIGLAPLLLFMPLKSKLALPRLGYAQIQVKRTLPLWIIGSIGAVLLATALIAGFFFRESLGMTGTIAIAIFGIAFITVLIGGINRIIGYAIMVPLFIIAGLGLKFLSPVGMIIVGIAICLMGIWMLIRFLRKYPVLDEEVPHASE